MEELLQLEKDLSFISFDHEDAYHLGQMLVDKVNTQNLKSPAYSYCLKP